MQKRLFSRVLLAALPMVALTACFDVERPDPIMLEGRNTFPSDPTELRNEYNYTLDAELRNADGELQADESRFERGTLRRRYLDYDPALLVSPLYEVRDQWWAFDGELREAQYQQGFQDSESHFVYYKDATGELVDGDSGLPLFWAQLAVGHRETARMWYQGEKNRWEAFVEIEVIQTEVIETEVVDVEAYLVRLRGDDEDNQNYTGTDDLRLTWQWWVSPELGIVREQKVVFERDEDGSTLRRILETDLRRYRE